MNKKMIATVTVVMLLVLGGFVYLSFNRQAVSIHLYDSPQNAGGFASGINPDTIRAVVGGRIVPREEISIAKVTDPSKKKDPGSPNDEFIVSLNPHLPILSSDKDVHLFCRDGAGNQSAFRLVHRSGGSNDWQEAIGSEAETLYKKYFDHLKRNIVYRETASEYNPNGVYGGLLIKDGNVVCGWGMDEWQLYEVTGSRLKDLRDLGLEHVDKVECLIWGAVDNKKNVIDIRDYKILKIYPKRR